MSIRGFPRLTNALTKTIKKLALSIALYDRPYNLAGIQKTFRNSLAMAAGVTDRLWSVADIVAMIGGKSN